MKESIEKHLSHVKIDQNQLNHALMLSIDNFRLEEHADECVLILLRYTHANLGTRLIPTAKLVFCPFTIDM